MNNTLLIFENISLLSLIIIAAPMLISLCLLFVKNKLSNNSVIYLYAFSTGLLIILSTLGLIKEGYDGVEDILSHSSTIELHSDQEIIFKVLIIGFGVLSGLIIAIVIKTLVFKIQNKKILKISSESKHHLHDDAKCCVVNVEEIIKKNGKLAAIFIVSSHKFIDGISLGLLANSAETLFGFENIGIIILFIIHDLPITIVIFFLQRSANVSKAKTFLYIFLISIITVPFMFLGGFVGDVLTENPQVSWLFPFLECLAGGVLLFTTIMEFVPEFIHNNHLCSKHWFITVVWLCAGIMLSLIMSLIHIHGHNDENSHSLEIVHSINNLLTNNYIIN